MDIQHLLEPSLSICYFIWDDQIYFIDNAGPICLSLMVVIAEGYLQNIGNIALNNALRDHCAPKSFLRYVDDSHTRFNNENEVDEFLTELNSQDSCIQYTVEKEVKGQLAFLDVNIISNQQGQYEFKVTPERCNHKCATEATFQHKSDNNQWGIQRVSCSSLLH